MHIKNHSLILLLIAIALLSAVLPVTDFGSNLHLQSAAAVYRFVYQ